MARTERGGAFGQPPAGGPAVVHSVQAKQMKSQLVFEDKDGERTVRYHGSDSRAGQDSKQKDQKVAYYGLMILDKKREVFRLVPIQKHLYFEQQKTLVPKVLQQQPVTPDAPARRPESASDFDFANVNKKKEVTAPKKSGKKALQAIFRNKAFVIGQRLPAKNQGN